MYKGLSIATIQDMKEFRRQQLSLKMSINVSDLLNSNNVTKSFNVDISPLDKEIFFSSFPKIFDIIERHDDFLDSARIFGDDWELSQKNLMQSRKKFSFIRKLTITLGCNWQ